ncbi:MAG: hypothetical protein WC709_03810 [Thermoleophilia bacterium]
MRRQPLSAILLANTIVLTLLALLTLIPWAGSSESLLGYRALCSFTPISTMLLVILAASSCFVRKRAGHYR